MVEYPIYTVQQLGQALRNQRKALGRTQGAAGADVGVLPKTVSALESKPGASSIASLFKLLSALDLELVLRPKKAEAGNRSAVAKSPAAEW
jgi:HTH-type transcriptional regulator/antitoxin HipB